MARNRDDKSGGSFPKKTGLSGRLGNLSNWERFGGVLAILLFFFSIYLSISFISFFFSGGSDQSLLDATLKETITNPKIRFENAGGRLGAILSDLFINKGFGIASIGVVYLFIIVSLRLARIGKVSIRRNFAYGLFLIIWTSITFEYFFSSLYEKSFILPGGTYGKFICPLIISTIGKIGTFFLILVSMVTCIIIAFESAWPTIKKWITYRQEK